MQLKIKRSQREAGVFSKTAVFCVEARASFTPEEKANIVRYKLHTHTIYNSEASKDLLAKGMLQNDGTAMGVLKSAATLIAVKMKLNITVGSLEKGETIECKSLDEMIAAENTLRDACANLREYLIAAATFDGREVVIDYTTVEAKIVAIANGDASILPPSPANPQLAHSPA